MPKNTTPNEGLLTLSIRLPHLLALWLEESAEKNGVSRNHVCRDLFDDAANFYGLPKVFTDRLEADAKAKGYDPSYPRRYIADIVARYAEGLSPEKADKKR